MVGECRFQIKLDGKWTDCSDEDDKILKRGYMSGIPVVRLTCHGQRYEYDFKRNEQRNLDSMSVRYIRPPCKWSPPSPPVAPCGQRAVVKVREGQPGKCIRVEHPLGGWFSFQVPHSARKGQTMLVLVPDKSSVPDKDAPPLVSGTRRRRHCVGSMVSDATGRVVTTGGAAGAVISGLLTSLGTSLNFSVKGVRLGPKKV